MENELENVFWFILGAMVISIGGCCTEKVIDAKFRLRMADRGFCEFQPDHNRATIWLKCPSVDR